jgi:hypothetical protein
VETVREQGEGDALRDINLLSQDMRGEMVDWDDPAGEGGEE